MSLQSRKNVTVTERPSAVFHYTESDPDEPVASRKTDAILRAAKKNLLTLMELDVSRLPGCMNSACSGDL